MQIDCSMMDNTLTEKIQLYKYILVNKQKSISQL